jgi:iron complex outermembrane receptor protein
MTKRNVMHDAVRYALFASTGALALNMGVVSAQEDDAEVRETEEVLVTGSRITRSTLNSISQETIVISAEDMKIQGDISVADALRSSNLNSLGSFRESSGNSAQSNATIDLRGVGAGRTLVMINGRRVAGSPSLGGGGTVNLNMIPFSAVDRIEIVADGASAIYGSDAVAGVVNIILKRGYDGFKLTGRFGDRDRDSGEEESLSMLFGASSDRGSVTFGLEYDRRDPIFDADRDFTAASYGDYDGDGDIVGYAETVGVSFYGYSAINPNWSPDVAYDPNDKNTWYVTPGANCQDDPSGTGFVGEMRADLVFGPEAGYYCGYAYALVSANRASLERVNSWVSAEYEINDSLDVYLDAIVSDNESFGRYAPPAAPGPTIPGDPRNDIGATFGYFRWTDIGTRDNIVNDTMVDINTGLKWEVSDNVKVDMNYSHSEYRSASVGMYYLSYGGLEYNINYDISDFDQFVANIKTTTLNDDRQTLTRWSGGVQWDMFDMAGGTAAVYLGAEYYEIKYSALVDAQSEAGLVGGSAGNSAEGYRDVTAYMVEGVFPILDWMELSAAFRADDYSDFGNATSPRLGINVAIPGYEQLRLRASWGEGFRAADLSDLYGATSFSAATGTDFWGCEQSGQSPCPSRQFDTYTGSNPDLDAEESESLSFGADWDFWESDMMSWKASATWISLSLDNTIDQVTAQDLLNQDYSSRTSGGSGSQYVQRNSLGQVVEITAGFVNGAIEQKREALDLGLAGTIDTSFGVFSLRYTGTKYLKYEVEEVYGNGVLIDVVGTLGFPEWRSNAQASWAWNNFFANLAWDYIGESESRSSDDKYDSWDQLNASVGYNFGSWGQITIGANNLTDEDPLLNDFGTEVDEYQYPKVGRVYYAEYTIEF